MAGGWPFYVHGFDAKNVHIRSGGNYVGSLHYFCLRLGYSQCPFILLDKVTSFTQLIFHRSALLGDKRNGFPHLFQLPVVYAVGYYNPYNKKKGKNRYRFKPFSGVALIVLACLPTWAGVAYLYGRDPILGLPLLGLGVVIVVYGMSQVIANTEDHSDHAHDECEIDQTFNSEAFPSHLSGNCNTKSVDSIKKS